MKKAILVLVVVVGIVSCSWLKLSKEEKGFFENISKLCGQNFEGRVVFPDDPSDPFAGSKLVMRVEKCDRSEIHIPFDVGENRSRTWIISKTKDGLLFKHDHHHEDGTPEDLTMYGGLADGKGSAFEQSFPADAQTAAMLPEAVTNVWTLKMSEDGTTFSYVLKRHDNLRFHADFDLTKPVVPAVQ
jgi:hypothetical protein